MSDDILSEEDKALFQNEMKAVAPLNKTNKIKQQPQAPSNIIPPKRSTAGLIKPAEKKEFYLSDYIKDPVQSDTLLSYCIPGIPGKGFKELKNGHIPWEARLDLHGLTSETAKNSLMCFIENQTQSNKRCLLIIHGKGGHQGRQPVIKNLVHLWLPQFQEVIAYHSALPKDGGTGAVYVLLRRRRNLHTP